MAETSDLRSQLHKVADDALANTGKWHYRFYGYTEAKIENDAQYLAPLDSKRAAATIPGVCSGFIWHMMKRNGMHLAGPTDLVQSTSLTQAQKDMGAKADGNTLDGLYLYTAAERGRAALWLHDQIYNQATDTIDQKAEFLGSLVEWITKTADHVSNEFLNAFSRDRVVTSDDDSTWSNTADGRVEWTGQRRSVRILGTLDLPRVTI